MSVTELIDELESGIANQRWDSQDPVYVHNGLDPSDFMEAKEIRRGIGLEFTGVVITP